MIDTIKFKIPCDQLFFQELSKRGNNLIQKDNFLGMENVYKTFLAVPVGEYGYNVQLYSVGAPFGNESLYLEYSMPKVLFGHNLGMVRDYQVQQVTAIVFSALKAIFPNFTKYSLWEVQRLDLCYMWDCESVAETQYVIDSVKYFIFPRKNLHFYKSTAMFAGRSSAIRFYLKWPEYKKTDYKRLKLFDKKYAEFILEKSLYTIRFEYEMRKSDISTKFKKKLMYSDLADFCPFFTLLEDLLSKFQLNPILPPNRSKLKYFKSFFNLSKKFQGYEPFAKRGAQADM